ncbi:MAG: hypothetical protein KJ886_01540 [Candidatus Thermoplasmatota archaeon]|nr:hypothetical protein [Candidatus Thermoplasmatota archaeon]MBU4189667.1 hypothetical protein [Candidatus Thermoplasmatota archaeon]MBU4256442.1 hypothetical protein [Candidatus Thermoplasmatota archaeon]MCG2825005.1 hypothetical protein [Thermoplasmatales archaeon]
MRQNKDSSEAEYKKLMTRAKKMPGIAELMEVYGQYELLLRQTQEYLGEMEPKIILSTTDASA